MGNEMNNAKINFPKEGDLIQFKTQSHEHLNSNIESMATNNIPGIPMHKINDVNIFENDFTFATLLEVSSIYTRGKPKEYAFVISSWLDGTNNHIFVCVVYYNNSICWFFNSIKGLDTLIDIVNTQNNKK